MEDTCILQNWDAVSLVGLPRLAFMGGNNMDYMELIEYLLSPISQIGLIIGIAEVIKRLGMDTKWIPLIDIGLGIASGLLINWLALGYGIAQSIIMGIAMGLSACGLFSGVKNVTEDR